MEIHRRRDILRYQSGEELEKTLIRNKQQTAEFYALMREIVDSWKVIDSRSKNKK